MRIEKLTIDAIALLKNLIETSSFSSEEQNTALLIESWFLENKIAYQRTQNNVWAVNKYFDESKPTFSLNSHHDTVQPNKHILKILSKPLLKTENYMG